LDVQWEVASITVPVTKVELVVNGEVQESVSVPPGGASGNWSVHVQKSSWLALMVRGHYPDKPEIVAAHSSPVMVTVDDTAMMQPYDAVTILEQIEGAISYLDKVGTRAEDNTYRRMRLALTSAHRRLHNRMHQANIFHETSHRVALDLAD
jgi:hypothetical protein